MRIGVDARELGGRSTGVGRYLSSLLAAWAGDPRARAHEFLLYSPEPLPAPWASGAQPFTIRVVAGDGGTLWEQMHLRRAAARDGLDVFFAPGYSAPLALAVPRVVAIHDVSFAAHPEWFRAREGLRRRWLARQSAAGACAVITISEFSRRELVEHLGVADARIRVIPPGVAPAAPSPAREPGERVLYVGSIFNRRHIPDLIRAFAALARRHDRVALDLVGENRTHPHEDLAHVMQSERIEHRVRWRSYVSDEEIQELYASAGAFAFLSEYEGLGLTPLEALAAGVPPLLLETPIARESCQDAALYVTAGDISGITGALERLLFDQALRSRLLAAAPGVLARYDRARAAADTLSVLETCAGRDR